LHFFSYSSNLFTFQPPKIYSLHLFSKSVYPAVVVKNFTPIVVSLYVPFFLRVQVSLRHKTKQGDQVHYIIFSRKFLDQSLFKIVVYNSQFLSKFC